MSRCECKCNCHQNQQCGKPLPIKPQVKVVKRYVYKDICHEVPCHTHYVTHTIYRHKYVPKYTCSKENTCEDVHLNPPKGECLNPPVCE